MKKTGTTDLISNIHCLKTIHLLKLLQDDKYLDFRIIGINMEYVKVRIGKRLTIPKQVAQKLGIGEGTLVRMYVKNGKLIIDPSCDAI